MLLFLIQRAADVRCGRSATANHRIFHPKLYVVERATDPSLGIDAPDSIVIAGSANWSRAALSPGGEANVEVATLHRVSGHAFSTPDDSTHLGSKLAQTARILFDQAPILAAWAPAFAVENPAPSLALPADEAIDSPDIAEGPPARRLPAALARLALAAQALLDLRRSLLTTRDQHGLARGELRGPTALYNAFATPATPATPSRPSARPTAAWRPPSSQNTAGMTSQTPTAGPSTAPG